MNYLSYKPQPTKQIHPEMAVPFEVHLLNTACIAMAKIKQRIHQFEKGNNK